MPESRQGSQFRSMVAVVNRSLVALSAARTGDRSATRRELRGVALALAAACRVAGEAELAGVIERSLYVTSGLSR